MSAALHPGSPLIFLGSEIWVAFVLYYSIWPPRQEEAMGLAIILPVVVLVGWAINLIGTLILGFALKGSNRTRGNIAVVWIGVLGIGAPILILLPVLWE